MAFITLLSVVMLSLPSPAPASPRIPFSIAWNVVEVTAPHGPVELRKTRTVPFVRIAPANLIRIAVDVPGPKGRLFIKAGTVLAWNSLDARVACEPKLDEYGAFRCLEDSDGDGKFDQLTGITASDFGAFFGSRTDYLLGTFKLGGHIPLVTPVPVPGPAAADAVAPVDLEFAFTTQASLIQKSGFALCARTDRGKSLMGGPQRERFCTLDMLFRYGDYPATQPLAGGSVTVRGIADAVATIELTAPRVGSRVIF
jgi:hypothetical protein